MWRKCNCNSLPSPASGVLRKPVWRCFGYRLEPMATCSLSGVVAGAVVMYPARVPWRRAHYSRSNARHCGSCGDELCIGFLGRRASPQFVTLPGGEVAVEMCSVLGALATEPLHSLPSLALGKHGMLRKPLLSQAMALLSSLAHHQIIHYLGRASWRRIRPKSPGSVGSMVAIS